MNHTPRFRTVLSCTLLVVSFGAGATACSDSSHPLSAEPYDAAGQIVFSTPPGGEKANFKKPLEVTSKGGGGRITDVTATDTWGRYLAGELTADGSRWRSTAPLAAGTRYTVRVATEASDGAPGSRKLSFSTAAPTSKELLKVEFGPEPGTYGVGQPVTAKLSAPVKSKEDRALVERSLKVRSSLGAEGAWHWVDDQNLHFRPKEFWPANSSITATSTLEGVKVGALYGDLVEPLRLTTGDRVSAVTDAGTHQMSVFRNGEKIKTIPVTTGKPGFATRNGIKVVLGKEQFVRMRSETVGISSGSSESYDMPVYWATRVTWSGEYVHAAPWSVGSQGSANVSHGCTGMSTDDARWFFETFRQGDIVQVVNSTGDTMENFGNGFGDWNLTWDEWRDGSVLMVGVEEGGGPARLSPEI